MLSTVVAIAAAASARASAGVGAAVSSTAVATAVVVVRGIPPPENGLEEHVVAPLGLGGIVSLQSFQDVREVVVEGNIAHLVDTVGKGDAVFQGQLV